MVGEIKYLKIHRLSDFAYMLREREDSDDIFMHFNDTVSKYEAGEEVEVFIYFDNKKRICATDKLPIIIKDEADFLEVIDDNQRIGLFLDLGINKSLLIANEDLPYNGENRPKIGDKLFVRMKAVKSGLFGKMVNKNDLNLYVDPIGDLEVGKQYKARIIKVGKEGLNLITNSFHHVFVYKLHKRKEYRLGEEIDVKIINEKNNDFNGSLIENKEKMMFVDSDVVLDYLKKHKSVDLDAKSNAHEIFKVFNMSKRAYKIAIGKLYKERKVYFENGSTFYIEN